MDSSQRVRAILSFVHAADAGSFAAAARILAISSAAVSKNVASLEKALGVRLMNRTTRTLQLTDEGALFLQQARIALQALDTAVDTVVSQRAGPSGRIRISTSTTFGHGYLMPQLPGLLARYPELSIEVDFDDRIVDLVREGYDLVIRGGSIADSALISRPIYRMIPVLVAAPAYLERYGIPVSPDGLNGHRLIARRFLGGRVANWSFRQRDGGISSVDPSANAVLTLTTPESVIQAACSGLGIARIGVHLVYPCLLSGELQLVLQDYHHPENYEMVIQYPHRALLPSRVRVTVDYLLEAFARCSELHVPLDTLGRFVVQDNLSQDR